MRAPCMDRFRRQAVLVLSICSAVPSISRSQPAVQRIGYVFPAGAQQGTTCQVRVGGQSLDGVSKAYVTGEGVRATVAEHVKPINAKQATTLRDRLAVLQKQPRDPNTVKEIAEIRRQLATFRPPNPALAETVTLEVQVAEDARPGQRELRLWTPRGLTNPLVFWVGLLPESSEPASSGPRQPRTGRAPQAGQTAQGGGIETQMTIQLPSTVNGQILPGGADLYRFQGRKGQSLVAAATARELIPYLADAVPGWFQATLALYDAKGRELAYDDDFRFHPDPVLHHVLPEDGEYTIEIKDAIYRGREDFVYRLSLGELPFVTSIFPLGGRAGTQTRLELQGWNLPRTSLTMDNTHRGPGVYPLSACDAGWISNEVHFAVDALPECLEQGPKADLAGADAGQQVLPPVVVNGRIDRSGDEDAFRFEGRAGDEVVAEVYARRLDSPLDSMLRLTDPAGRQVAFNDDHEDKGAGLTTHHADSWLRAVLPTHGTYTLHLGDAQRKGGPEYGYRLRISPPRPDFDLRIVPSTLAIRGGATIPVTVYALRRDGFSGPISLALLDPAHGFTLGGARVPANQDRVRVTLTAPQPPLDEPVPLALEGRALIGGQEAVRPAVAADDMMQAFAYSHLVPAQGLTAVVARGQAFRTPLRILSPVPVEIPAGGTARVRIGAPSRMFLERFQLELSDPPEGVVLQGASPSRQGAELVLHSDAAKVKPGLSGNLIVHVLPSPPQDPNQRRVQANRRRVPVSALPAIPFDITEAAR